MNVMYLILSVEGETYNDSCYYFKLHVQPRYLYCTLFVLLSKYKVNMTG